MLKVQKLALSWSYLNFINSRILSILLTIRIFRIIWALIGIDSNVRIINKKLGNVIQTFLEFITAVITWVFRLQLIIPI